MSSRRVKPPPSNSDNARGISCYHCLLQHAIGPRTKLKLVSIPPRFSEFTNELNSLGLDALPRTLLLIGTKEKVAVTGQHFIEKCCSVTPAAFVNQFACAVELTLLEAIRGQKNPALIVHVFGFISFKIVGLWFFSPSLYDLQTSLNSPFRRRWNFCSKMTQKQYSVGAQHCNQKKVNQTTATGFEVQEHQTQHLYPTVPTPIHFWPLWSKANQPLVRWPLGWPFPPKILGNERFYRT